MSGRRGAGPGGAEREAAGEPRVRSGSGAAGTGRYRHGGTRYRHREHGTGTAGHGDTGRAAAPPRSAARIPAGIRSGAGGSRGAAGAAPAAGIALRLCPRSPGPAAERARRCARRARGEEGHGEGWERIADPTGPRGISVFLPCVSGDGRVLGKPRVLRSQAAQMPAPTLQPARRRE